MGGAKTKNVSNIVANVTSNYISSVTTRCEDQTSVMNVVNLDGCQLNGAHIDLNASGTVKASCTATVSVNSTALSDLTNQVAQVAQATAQGFGLAPAKAGNVVDLCLGTTQNVFSYITAQSDNTDVVGNYVNCTNSSINGKWINMNAVLGKNNSSVFKISQVASLTNQLNSTVDQASKATSKDFFGQMADMGSTVMICMTVLGSVGMLGFFYLGGKTVGNASSIITGLLTSPVFIGGIFLAGALVNAYLYARNSKPYTKEVPPQGKTTDDATIAKNRKGFIISELAMAAGGIGIIVLFTIFGGGNKSTPAAKK